MRCVPDPRHEEGQQRYRITRIIMRSGHRLSVDGCDALGFQMLVDAGEPNAQGKVGDTWGT